MAQHGKAKLLDLIVLHHVELQRQIAKSIGPLGHEILILDFRPFARIGNVNTAVFVINGHGEPQ